MPIAARNVIPGNPSFTNPPVTPVNNSVLTRGDGLGASTDGFVMDLGTDTAYAVAAITTKITGAPSISVSLQGTMDGSTWTTLTTSTSNTGDTNFTATNANVQFSALRVFINSTSGGTAPTIAVAVTAFTAPQTGSLAGTQNVSGTVTANQGTPAVAANRWPVVITDTGGVNQVSVNNAFGGGVGAARVQLLGATGGTLENAAGSAVLVAKGSLAPTTSLSAVTTGNGTTVDFGAAFQTVSAVFVGAGTTSGGTLNLQVSADGTTWLNVGTALAASTLAASGTATLATNAITANGIAFRYARAVVATTITGGGTVTAVVSAA